MKKTREYALGMPNLGMVGLSEGWLCRELGDLHWNFICDGLRTESSKLTDSLGNRLYATFTRLRYVIEGSPADFKENDLLRFVASGGRYGASLFFSKTEAVSDDAKISAKLMSTFSSRQGEGNTALTKGEPHIPEGCEIFEQSTMPLFGQEYRQHRKRTFACIEFETRYDINPFHDINGVCLVYFAAYPIISDICEQQFIKSKFAERGIDALRLGTVERDVFYFANCDIDETVIYRLHQFEMTADGFEAVSTLSRASDGTCMAEVCNRKTLIPRR